jgi:hypothetical protein
MTTEKEFRASAFREELLALLNHPALKAAVEIVGETARPRGGIEPRPNAHLDTLVAQRYHKQAGIQAALDHLQRLTQPLPEEAPPEDELESRPFFSSLPKVVQDALREQMQKNDNQL